MPIALQLALFGSALPVIFELTRSDRSETLSLAVLTAVSVRSDTASEAASTARFDIGASGDLTYH